MSDIEYYVYHLEWYESNIKSGRINPCDEGSEQENFIYIQRIEKNIKNCAIRIHASYKEFL